MLRSEHAIITFDSGRAIPDRLTRVTHGHYLAYAQRMLAVYRAGVGITRRELHRSIANILTQEPDCPRKRIAAFCKLLDDVSEFADDQEGAASELRLRVFSIAARYHPLVAAPDRIFERAEAEIKQAIAMEIGKPWSEVESSLYCDVLDYQPLLKFEGYPDEAALLSRYNVAQLQACLYRADRMTIHADADFASLVRYAKLSRLLLDIRRIGPSQHRIDFSGPASVLHETRRYGTSFARFIPAVLACKEWTLRASLRTPWGTPASLNLSSADGYRSHLPAPAEFDSSVEERFAKKFGEEQDGWRLHRGAVILHEGQTTFVPDFVFRRTDGQEIYLEIVGFWTPEYLEKKRETLRRFHHHRIALAVAHSSIRQGAAISDEVLVYKTSLKVEPVLQMLTRLTQLPHLRG